MTYGAAGVPGKSQRFAGPSLAGIPQLTLVAAFF